MPALNGLLIIVALLISYFIGSVNFGLIIGKLIRQLDIRDFYSKNAGATNASRVLGRKLGFIVFGLDMIKLPIAIVITGSFSFIQTGSSLNGEFPYFFSSLAVIAGHMGPVGAKFRGGKGVSTFIGLTGMINPWFFLAFSVVGWGLIFIFKKVSVSSLAATLTVAIICGIPQISNLQSYSLDGKVLLPQKIVWFNHYAHRAATGDRYGDSLLFIDLNLTLATILVGIKHYQNILRLIHRTENPAIIKKK